ncbi:MAG: tRNA (adenosine(37)-N6)-threonylcarbamoyltransferase complex dimerization subunit type 1 TsaB [Burkholderiales bacterium]|nr:tRNA (adenosine(37)-N6)-threonylcarbamoyltransferase complex dimerization subunit type 1 TsaB [Burkholderiales bacterium]
MNLLAFDTGTESMSIAVARTVDGRVRQWQHSAAGGARASTDLIPAILDLLQPAGLGLQELDTICFGAGPGSFTGLRTACSVAQGLAFGAGVAVLPVDSLLAVAEEARHTAWALQPSGVVTALLDARMDELYGATFAWDAQGRWTELQPSTLVRPESVARVPAHAATEPWLLAGNVFAVYGDRVAADALAAATAQRMAALPTASAMLRLAPQLIAAGKTVAAEHAWPSYIRDKVAKTTAERMAEKAAMTTGGGL